MTVTPLESAYPAYETGPERFLGAIDFKVPVRFL